MFPLPIVLQQTQQMQKAATAVVAGMFVTGSMTVAVWLAYGVAAWASMWPYFPASPRGCSFHTSRY